MNWRAWGAVLLTAPAMMGVTPIAQGATLADPPGIWPAPQQIQTLGSNVPLPSQVLVIADSGADQSTRDVVVASLRDGGATDVRVVEYPNDSPAPLKVRVGALNGDNVRSSGVTLPTGVPAEGYFVSVAGTQVVLGGADSDGSYHAAQTLWQLMQVGNIPSVRITDWPDQKVRGVVQGAYGPQWTHAEELDQIEFYGRVKFNHFIYAPKPDPYHRDNWRALYPAARRAELTALVASAKRHHVTFTYALAPGLSICHSSASDWTALTNKLRSLYDIGVRSFNVALDDLPWDRWHCSADQSRYGSPSRRNVARAQVDLLNRLQREFLPTLAGVGPLQMVPGEYYDTADSPYKSTYRTGLDSRVVVMWTGVGVTPTSIEIFEARDAQNVWGRKPLVWDNYPVNDYPQAAGRLLLGPYAERKAGIGAHLTGITANPMNQAAASKVVMFGLADFSWNEDAYDPLRNYRQFADYLSGNKPETTEALLTFFDLNHLAPVTGEDTIWQPQAPVLASKLDEFREGWDNGEGHAAIDALWEYGWLIDQAPSRIRAGVLDDMFTQEADLWLDATALWGEALLTTLNGLASRVNGDEASARARFAESAELVRRAEAIWVPPGVNEHRGPVKIGDGVLDEFLSEAPNLR